MPKGSHAIVSVCADGGEGTVALLENAWKSVVEAVGSLDRASRRRLKDRETVGSGIPILHVMDLDQNAYYSAVNARDARFDADSSAR